LGWVLGTIVPMRSAFSLLCLLALGCSSDRDAIEKRLSTLRDDITRVQAENDRLSERVETLEVKQSAPPAPAEAASARVERPALKVVKLVPDEAGGESGAASPGAEPSPEERPDAPGTRPVIRVRGKELKGDELGGRSITAAEAR